MITEISTATKFITQVQSCFAFTTINSITITDDSTVSGITFKSVHFSLSNEEICTSHVYTHYTRSLSTSIESLENYKLFSQEV